MDIAPLPVGSMLNASQPVACRPGLRLVSGVVRLSLGSAAHYFGGGAVDSAGSVVRVDH